MQSSSVSFKLNQFQAPNFFIYERAASKSFNDIPVPYSAEDRQLFLRGIEIFLSMFYKKRSPEISFLFIRVVGTIKYKFPFFVNLLFI